MFAITTLQNSPRLQLIRVKPQCCFSITYVSDRDNKDVMLQLIRVKPQCCFTITYVSDRDNKDVMLQFAWDFLKAT